MTRRRAVLDRGRDDVLPCRIELERGIYRGIIGLRAAAGENDLARLAPEERRHALAREIERTPHLRTKTIAARRVPEIFGEKWQHFLDHGRIELRGRVVIEIDDLLAGDHGREELNPRPRPM